MIHIGSFDETYKTFEIMKEFYHDNKLSIKTIEKFTFLTLEKPHPKNLKQF